MEHRTLEGYASVRAIVTLEYVDAKGTVTCAVAEHAEHGAPIGEPTDDLGDLIGGYGAYHTAGHRAFRKILLRLGRVRAQAMTAAELRAYEPSDADEVRRRSERAAAASRSAREAEEAAEHGGSAEALPRAHDVMRAWRVAAEAEAAKAAILPDDDDAGEDARLRAVLAWMKAGMQDHADAALDGYRREGKLRRGGRADDVARAAQGARMVLDAVARVRRERFEGDGECFTVALASDDDGSGTCRLSVAPTMAGIFARELRMAGYVVTSDSVAGRLIVSPAPPEGQPVER